MASIVIQLPGTALTGESAGLDTAIQKQFAEIQRQLMTVIKTQQQATQAMQGQVRSVLSQQQDALLEAITRLTQTMRRSGRGAADPDLKEAIESLRTTVSTRPQTKTMVQMPAEFMARMDQLEAAIRESGRRSRNRTFGSNF